MSDLISDMRNTITVEVEGVERQQSGANKRITTTIGPFYAAYIPQDGREVIAGGQVQAEEMAIFKVMRHSGTRDIKAKDAVVYNGKRFDIQSVVPFPATTQKFLELTCVARRVG